MMKWAAIAKAFDRYLRLRTFPVAFKLFESATALDGIKGNLQRRNRGSYSLSGSPSFGSESVTKRRLI